MQNRSLTDPTSWRVRAAIHDYRRSADPLVVPDEKLPALSIRRRFWAQCQDGFWFFLPWHRMDLHFFEQIVAAAVVQLGGPRTERCRTGTTVSLHRPGSCRRSSTTPPCPTARRTTSMKRRVTQPVTQANLLRMHATLPCKPREPSPILPARMRTTSAGFPPTSRTTVRVLGAWSASRMGRYTVLWGTGGVNGQLRYRQPGPDLLVALCQYRPPLGGLPHP
jgi:hypothetical protein